MSRDHLPPPNPPVHSYTMEEEAKKKRGERQKDVSKAYRKGWDRIFGEKKRTTGE